MGDKDLKEVKKTPLKEHSHNIGEKFVKNSLKTAITGIESELKEADRQAGIEKAPGESMPGVAARKSVDTTYKELTAGERQIEKIRNKRTYEEKLKRNQKAKEVEDLLKEIRTNSLSLTDKSGNTYIVDAFNVNEFLNKIKTGDIEVESIEKNSIGRKKELKTRDKIKGINRDDKFSRASKTRLQKMNGTKAAESAISEAKKFELKKRAGKMRQTSKGFNKRVKETSRAMAKAARRGMTAVAQLFSNPIVLISIGVCIASFFLINLIISFVTGTSFIFTTQQQKNDEMEALTADMTYSEYQYQLARDLLAAGFEPDDIAAMFGSFIQESGIQPTAVQPDAMNSAVNQGRLPDTITTTQAYIDGVNSGAITKEQFVNDGVGFGLAQWTYPDRKEGLYDKALEYAQKHHSPFSLTSYYVQYEYLLYELTEKTDWPGGHGKTMKELLEAAPADPNEEHNKAWVFAKRFENPATVEQVRITNYQIMRPYVQIVKNGGDGGGNFTVLNTRYFYQKGSGSCQTCSIANIWMRYFYQQKAQNWEAFGVDCNVSINGSPYKNIYKAIVTNADNGDSTDTWVSGGKSATHTGWLCSLEYTLTYGGVTGKSVLVPASNIKTKNELIALVQSHPTGVVVYSSYNKSNGGTGQHGIVLTRYDAKQDAFYYLDPALRQMGSTELSIKENKDCCGIVSKINSGNLSSVIHYLYIEPM